MINLISSFLLVRLISLLENDPSSNPLSSASSLHCSSRGGGGGGSGGSGGGVVVEARRHPKGGGVDARFMGFQLPVIVSSVALFRESWRVCCSRAGDRDGDSIDEAMEESGDEAGDSVGDEDDVVVIEDIVGCDANWTVKDGCRGGGVRVTGGTKFILPYLILFFLCEYGSL